jgi:hypothetical protein
MSEQSEPKRTPAWKIVGIVAGVIVLSIVALCVWATVAGNRKYERIREKSRARLAEVRNADGRRPVLRGTAESGNAWDDYEPAQAEVKKFGNAGRLGEIVERSPKADPEIAKAALAAHGAAIDLLRRGAGRAASKYPHGWEKGVNMPTPPLLAAMQLSSLAVLKARAFVDDGKPREAAGVLLDVCQYGRDFGADGTLISYMVGISILSNGFNEIREQLAAGTFDAAALGDLDRGLEILDGSFPDYGHTLINEALLFGGLLDDSMTQGRGPARLLHADAVERIHESMAAAAKTESMSWSDAQKELQWIETEARKGWNPIASIAAPALVQQGSTSRLGRARLRAMRIAVHRGATSKELDLDDPFGGKMRTEDHEGVFRVWSVGKDGVDDGGTGDWKTASKDVVLELKKK